MTLQEFLSRLDVKSGHGDQYMAKCPAHDDKTASLSVGSGEKGIVIKCHAGCNTVDVLAAMGLTEQDLFYEPKRVKERPHLVATYQYISPDGKQYEKQRFSDKSFTWRQPDGKGGWIYSRKGISPNLYGVGKSPLPKNIYFVEGEKDVDNLIMRHAAAVSPPDGAKSKWQPQYTEALKGRHVVILPDNDAPGWELANTAAAELTGKAASVRILDLTKKWPDLPPKGDISDILEKEPSEDVFMKLEELESDTPEWTEAASMENNDLWKLFKTLDEFDEEDAKWLVPGWIPEGQITLLAADGGVGKTTLWCHVIAALSNGECCILDPLGYTRKPVKIVFITTEDSIKKKLRKKLREAGANMKNIITPDFSADKEGVLRGLKFGTPLMEATIKHFRSAACIFDPVQGFVPPLLNMGSRNAMRDCMAPLIPLGEESGTAFIVVCHTNKRKGAFGRDRIADSADLWDIARSVIMAGFTEEQGVRYLSNEKNNYAPLQETILFRITDGEKIVKVGTSWKRDRDYILDSDVAKSAPKREDCKRFLLKALSDAGGSMPTSELEEQAKRSGYSFSSIKRAKQDLKDSGNIRYFPIGSSKGGNRTWYTQSLVSIEENILDDELDMIPEDPPSDT